MVHQREDAVRDILEFSLHFDSALTRVSGLLFVAPWVFSFCSTLVVVRPGCSSTVGGVLVCDRQQIPASSTECSAGCSPSPSVYAPLPMLTTIRECVVKYF